MNMGSYGKTDMKNAPTTFRQSVASQQKQKPEKTGAGGGNVPYFVNQFKPSTEEPDVVRLLKGEYPVQLAGQNGELVEQTLAYYIYREHFDGRTNKSAICSAGPFAMDRKKRQPCDGCDIYWEERSAGKKQNNRMSNREMYVFSMLHHANYVKTEQLDRNTGAVKVNDDGQPYMNWVRMMAHERGKFAGKEMKDANALHWAMGFNHFNVIREYDKQIGKSCRACGVKAGRKGAHEVGVKSEAWCCQGCGEALIEVDSTELAPKQIDEITSDVVECAVCKRVGYLQEMVSCTECSDGTRSEIFDVDLEVQRVKPADGGNQTVLAIVGWANPHPIDPRHVEIARPLELPKIYAPTPLERQHELFGSSGRQPVTAGSKPYGGPPTLGGKLAKRGSG